MDNYDRERASKVFLECSNLLTGKSDREIAIIGVAYIEDILTTMLEARIVPGGIDLKSQDSFSFKVKLARAVGILKKTVYDSLKNISYIRNKFAHEYSMEKFCDEKLSSKIDSIFQLNREILEAVKNSSEKALCKEYKEEIDLFFKNKTNKLWIVIACAAGGFQGLCRISNRLEPQKKFLTWSTSS